MTQTTANTDTLDAKGMGNGNKKIPSNSFSAGDLPKHSSKLINNKDVAKWSSDDVQHWIKNQCKKFELKKATAEKFEMNGQALVLLTKHDFLRRSPDGGEVLYYALQRLINPNKFNSVRLDQNSSKNGSSGPHPRIVELKGNDGYNSATDASSPKPIIEEPDDPPVIRRSQSDTDPNDYFPPQQHPRPFFFRPTPMPPPVFTMSAGAAAAYFTQQQQPGFPNASMFAPPHHHHPHLHMHQAPFAHPTFIHQYHPMMSAQGILIEFMDDTDLNNQTPNGVNGPMEGAQDALYMVTVNGQRFIMAEEQVRQLVAEVHQRQSYQENLQQQQQFQRQQQFQQQQQQYFQQQQQQQQ